MSDKRLLKPQDFWLTDSAGKIADTLGSRNEFAK